MPEQKAGGPATIPGALKLPDFEGSKNALSFKERMRRADMVADLPASSIMQLMVLQGQDAQSLANEFAVDKRQHPEDSDEALMRRIYGTRAIRAFDPLTPHEVGQAAMAQQEAQEAKAEEVKAAEQAP